MKALGRSFLLLVIFFGGVLFVLAILSRHTMYQFTTYKIPMNNESKNMTWVSKVNGRMQCNELDIYKRQFNPGWLVLDSSCADGKDRLGAPIDVSYNEWLSEKFSKKACGQAYCYFKDVSRNESLIYFSSMAQDSDGQCLNEVADSFKGKALGWTVVQPRESQHV